MRTSNLFDVTRIVLSMTGPYYAFQLADGSLFCNIKDWYVACIIQRYDVSLESRLRGYIGNKCHSEN